MSDIARRDLLRLGVTGAAGLALGACGAAPGSSSQAASSPETVAERPAGRRRRFLLAYYSRPGENYYYGGRRDLRTGNTQVLASMIDRRVDCDVHRIRAADPYPDDYEATVARDVREQDSDDRPGIASRLASIEEYDVVVLASPLWNVRPPMIMRTFADRYEWAGKTVLPVTTYAVSGLGSAPEEYADACPGARIGRGLAVRGERVGSSGRALDTWLRQTGLVRADAA